MDAREAHEEKLLDAQEAVVIALETVRDAVLSTPTGEKTNVQLLEIEERLRSARDLLPDIVP